MGCPAPRPLRIKSPCLEPITVNSFVLNAEFHMTHARAVHLRLWRPLRAWPLQEHHRRNPHPNYEKPRMQCDQFILKHFAGSVTYDVAGFLEKNNDSLQVRERKRKGPWK